MTKYSIDQKIELVLNFYKSNLLLSQYSKAVGIDKSRLKNWIKTYDENGRSGFKKSFKANNEEIINLKKGLKKSKRESEDLKLRDEMFKELRELIDRKK
ncbi:hypothetical protein [Spiroplasma endosymbiont of Cantharis lateralis]|uniref:hypothetical protein n=1 Tax=Spiroplasma endosymbiont of Cantharis lateralis TaxID=3066277 RepID=UPI00313D9C3B